MSARGILAGKAFVQFNADKSPFVKAVRSMGSELKSFGGNVAKAGAILTGISTGMVAALVPVVLSFASAGDAAAKMSQRTGASAESLSVLQYAAESAGTSIGAIEGAMSKVRGDIGEFAQGNFEVANSYAQIGVDIRKLAQLKPEQQFALLAEQVSKIRNPTMQAAAANKIFGGSAEEMLPLVKQGAAGLAAAEKRARELGIVMSGDAAKAGEDLTQSFYDVTTSSRGLWNQVGQALAPTLTDLANQVSVYIGMASKWVAENHELIVTGAKIVAGIAAAGAVITGFGLAISAAGSVLGMAATAGVALTTVIGALLSPVGLATAGVIGLATAFFTMTETGRDSLQSIIDYFGDTAANIKAAWGGIVDALMAGDFAAAGKIAFLALQIEWLKVVEVVKSVWRTASTWFLDAWDVVTSGIAAGMTNAVAAVQSIWLQTIDLLKDAWSGAFAGMVTLASSALSAVLMPLKAVAKLLADVTGIDVTGALNEFDRMQKQGAESLTGDSMQAIFQREQDRKNKLGQIEADRQSTLANITEDRNNRISGRQAANDAAAASGKAAIDATAKELADAVTAASTARAAVDAKRAELTSKGNGKTATTSAGQNLNFGAAAKQATSGTFSAASAARLSSTTVDPNTSILRNIDRGIRQLVNKKATLT